MSNLIYLQCVKVGSKLRVRITSPNYNGFANCQFPRNLRIEGRRYSAPISDLSFSETRGKFFYRVNKNNIKIIDQNIEQKQNIEHKIKIDKIYENDEQECVVCMDNKNEVVLYKCGHFCMCLKCANKILTTTRKCPMCRQEFTMAVTKEQLQ
jgi:hypothetical protein